MTTGCEVRTAPALGAEIGPAGDATAALCRMQARADVQTNLGMGHLGSRSSGWTAHHAQRLRRKKPCVRPGWRRAQVALSEYIAGIYLKSCLPRARLTGTRRTDSRADRRPTPPPPSLAGGGPHRCSIRLSYVRRCALPVDPVVVRISLLQLLAGRSEKDFVDVHVLRLAHREDHHGGERVGREGDLHCFANAGRDIRFGDTVGEVRRERAR